MKSVIWFPALGALSLILAGCASHGPTSGHSETGPFDKNGNYVEAWADDPTKWRKPGSDRPLPSRADDLPQVAKNEEPPPNSNPLVPQGSSQVKPSVALQSKPKVEATPRESVKRPEVGESETSRPKPVLVKAKPKPQPQKTRYVVNKGDTLSGIASRYGTSVTALRGANGISGTLIRPGQSLVIPKR